jgi:hypothetical protein
MKVAQYEVLGWSSERGTRPGWDDRRPAYAREAVYVRDKEPNVSIVPPGTDISFCIISQHFVLGYFRRVPPGLIFVGPHLYGSSLRSICFALPFSVTPSLRERER